MEHPDLIAFLNMLPFVNGDLTTGDLPHSHQHDAHEPDTGVIRLDEYQRPRGHGRQIAL